MAKKDNTPVYLFHGRDDFSKGKELQKLLGSLVDPVFEAFDLDEYSGDRITASVVLTGASIVPMGSGKRVVLVKYAHKLPQEEQKELARNLEMIPPTGCIILSVPAPDIKDGKPVSGSDVLPELSRAIGRLGKVNSFDPVTKKRDIETRVIPFVTEQLAERGKAIDAGAASLLVARVGTDFTLLDTEIQKLCAYTMEKDRVTAEDIKECTSVTAEERVFDFIDALLKRQGQKAVALVEDLFVEGNDPSASALRLISLLSSQLRQLWQARMILTLAPGAAASGRSVTKEDMGEAAALFPQNSLLGKAPWLQNKFLAMARAAGFPVMARWFTIIADADAALKGIEEINEEPEDIVKMMVFSMVRQKENK